MVEEDDVRFLAYAFVLYFLYLRSEKRYPEHVPAAVNFSPADFFLRPSCH